MTIYNLKDEETEKRCISQKLDIEPDDRKDWRYYIYCKSMVHCMLPFRARAGWCCPWGGGGDLFAQLVWPAEGVLCFVGRRSCGWGPRYREMQLCCFETWPRCQDGPTVPVTKIWWHFWASWQPVSFSGFRSSIRYPFPLPSISFCHCMRVCVCARVRVRERERERERMCVYAWKGERERESIQ